MNVWLIDEDSADRRLARRSLAEAGYQVREADDGAQALRWLRRSRCALVVSAWNLPRLDGIQLCRALRRQGTLRDVYFIMLTTRQSREDRTAAAAAGVDRFLIKPLDPHELVMQVHTGRFLLGRTAEERRLLALGRLAESRDWLTGDHLERARNYARLLAEQLRGDPDCREVVDERYVELIYMASPLHDIGKSAVPDELLRKPGRSPDEEDEVRKAHTLRGAEMLEAARDRVVDTSFLDMARDIALTHHERFDGSGHPHHLAGERIPLSGRIMALADAYETLTTRRADRHALRHEEARSIIVGGAGTAFAPNLVRAFLERQDQFLAIRERFADERSAAASGSAATPPWRHRQPAAVQPPRSHAPAAGGAGSGCGAVPQDFGRYQIVRQIGRGNMATVYLAHDTRLEREVALKILRNEGRGHEVGFERCQEEAKAAATLSHPGICPVFDLGTIDGHHYIAMGYVAGHPLSRYIAANRHQPERKIALLVLKLARALEHAHRRGIVHRDLKPSNILVNTDGHPVITDFGLAWRIGRRADTRWNQDGRLVGTPAYMSPEQATGALEKIGPASDIYSLGVILYQLLTGRLPFEGTVARVIFSIVTETPDPPARYRPDVNPPLEQLCLRMMAKPISDRPPSMAAVSDAITQIVAELAHEAVGSTARPD